MKNSKLVALLKLLNPTELNEFGRFIQADFFNRKTTVRVMFKRLHACLKKDKAFPSKQALFKLLFLKAHSSGNKNLTEKQQIKKVNEVIFLLKKLIDQFLLWKQIQKDDFEVHWLQLEIYRERRADPLFFDHFEKMKEALGSRENLLPKSAFQHYQVMYAGYNHPGTNQLMQNIPGPGHVMESLDYAFLMSKLMHAWVLMGRKRVILQVSELELIDESLKLAEKEPYCQNWFIRFFSLLVTAQRDQTFTQSTFDQLNQLFRDHEEDCEPGEQTGLHNALINFCILGSMQTSRENFPNYKEKLLALYKIGVSEGYIFREGFLAYADFTNCISVACKLGETEWAGTFVQDYGGYLKPEIQEATLRLARAQVAYSAGKYQQSLAELNSKIKSSSPVDKLLERKYRVFCYYDLDRWDMCELAIASFLKFLSRNQELGEDLKTRVANFLKGVRKLIHHQGDAEALCKLATQVQSSGMMMDPEWLLERIKK